MDRGRKNSAMRIGARSVLERLYVRASQASTNASFNALRELSNRLTVSGNALPNLSSVSGWHTNVGALKKAFSMPVVQVLSQP